jgi:nitrate/nitrite-specific signal transduction histidine kinase
MFAFADFINESKLMLAGLKSNNTRLARRGASDEFIAAFEKAYDEARTLDDEQAALKSRLKEKTEALNNKEQELYKLYREAKRMVKLEIPQTGWKEFGIDDQQ